MDELEKRVITLEAEVKLLRELLIARQYAAPTYGSGEWTNPNPYQFPQVWC